MKEEKAGQPSTSELDLTPTSPNEEEKKEQAAKGGRRALMDQSSDSTEVHFSTGDGAGLGVLSPKRPTGAPTRPTSGGRTKEPGASQPGSRSSSPLPETGDTRPRLKSK
ncbi:unnamed protein product, partial [Heterosigma akashiwo]